MLAGIVGFGIASAGSGSSDNSTLGLSATSETPRLEEASSENLDSSASSAPSESANEDSILASTAQRDMSAGIQAIEEQEEAERRAVEEAQRLEEEQHQQKLEAAQQKYRQAASRDAAASALASLSEVDWSVGEEAFVAEWTARIDAYLEGSPLAGQGAAFAKAAWENCVDPRWSPAISNTESSKGENCFLPCNAWGWGQSSWSSWEKAIGEHVAGLAESYGYSLTYAYAKKYCPPNYDNWFNSTLSEMKRI